VEEQVQRYKMHRDPNWHLGPRAQSDAARDRRLRRKVQTAIEQLIWLAEVWPPNQQNKVFTETSIAKLVSRLLTVKYSSEDEKDRTGRERRQKALAAMFLEKGIIKCLDYVPEAYHERDEREAIGLVMRLKGVMLGPGAGFNYEL